MTQQILTLNSGHLSLESVLDVPDSSDKVPGVALCHPDPRYGGDMHNDVVVELARVLVESGIAALRFNMRGVGASDGEFDRGNGETDDALSALHTLELHERIDPSRIGVAGYSFGASIAIQAAGESSLVQAVVSIACPAPIFRVLGSVELLQPKLFVMGDSDHNFPVEQFRFLTKRYSQPREVSVVVGADHFFRGVEPAVGEMTTRFFTRWLTGDQAD
ncbi:MAG: dienelactone hydrolase family protein [SAR202 cluster bacterium]|jgi:hypothetical protein|nr:dienelactone hydrolase family protein [SAR202 cluster bacterium]MDP6662633.1 dienelactone hydrolase family protein [SAR202 cluster bacterium]MDP6798453.1 dienelactone hydrolase family protein [SAR202 cluster bacterium]|tara:strand:+ start:29 stop:682 length:654 start_codon:yes stop_codon:yes gene_type:complete